MKIYKGAFTKRAAVNKMENLRRGAFYKIFYEYFFWGWMIRCWLKASFTSTVIFAPLGTPYGTSCYLDYSFCFFQCILNQFPWQPHPWSTLTRAYHYHLNEYKQYIHTYILFLLRQVCLWQPRGWCGPARNLITNLLGSVRREASAKPPRSLKLCSLSPLPFCSTSFSPFSRVFKINVATLKSG